MYNEIMELGNEQIPYFRNQEFSNMMLELDANLKHILNMDKDDKNIFLTASGTAAMEAAVINCLDKNDRILIISGGSFGERFEQICEIYNLTYEVLRVENGECFEAERLNEYDNRGYTALLVNIHETSIGQLYPIDVISQFCTKNNILLIVDGISSVFADPLDFSALGIGVLIYSSQKALALPPGIAVVALKKSVYEKRVEGKHKCLYFDFNEYVDNFKRGQTPFTPAIGILYQMSKMVSLIGEQQIEKKIAYTKMLAEDFRNKALSNGFKIPQYPLSNALTPMLFNGDAGIYYRRLIEDYSITVNPCGGQNKDIMLRVGHIGNISVEDNSVLIKAFVDIREKIKRSGDCDCGV